ncbi:GlsB/YeaQ/YmgE family stress response membrane protein [Dokdonella sp.]|uniref:GlsB/YeaQ/YmgE family stress response membrane protein n=1 Tax=Dokdonella sp. TaxID=2291710 RepID=UPI00261FE69A|nr:GlsB/YeaQ/YmgE family stress response membrane protein [Dokdonella sp.]
MGLIWTVLIGFVVGVLAKFFTHGPGPKGFFLTAALGIAGSLVATFVGRALHWYAAGQSAGFIGAFVGALILLFLYHIAVRSRGPTT